MHFAVCRRGGTPGLKDTGPTGMRGCPPGVERTRSSAGPQPGGHTIDRIQAGERSFMVDGGTAPATIGNVHQALPVGRTPAG
jgi:hypothetical protein